MKKKNVFKNKMVRASSQKYPLLMASFFFEKSILKQSNFECRKIPYKRNVFKQKMVRVSSQKISFTHGLNFFFEKSILKQSNVEYRKIQYEKKRIKNKYIYSLAQKISAQQSAPSSTHCRAPAPQNV